MVKIAIVGQGYMGKTHAEAFGELGLGENIKYVVARSVRDRGFPAPGAQFVTDLDVALSDSELDVVCVCTPTATHAEIAIRALLAGKHVLLEKPIALTFSDAHRIIAAASVSDGKFMVAHVVRFFEGYALARKMAESGELGKLQSVRAQRTMAAPEWSSWISDEKQSGGVLVDFAIHDFDQANLILGVPDYVTSVPQGGASPSAIASSVTYRDGGVAEIITDSGLPQGTPFTSALHISGSAGEVDFEFTAPTVAERVEDLIPPPVNCLSVSTGSERSNVILKGGNPYREEIAYFLRCIETGKDPTTCTPDSSLLALATSLAASRSLKNRSAEKVRTL